MMTKSTTRFFSLLILIALVTVATWVPSPGSTVAVFAAAASNADANATQQPLNWLVTGPMGGDVRSLVIDPQDPERLYFGTIDGQMYTSADGGQRWARLAGFNYPGLYIDNLIVDPRSSQTIYAAAHRHKGSGARRPCEGLPR